jgi:hypothetical protein
VSVIVTVEFPGMQADTFIAEFQRDPERQKRISEDGRRQGAIHHLMAVSDDGIVVAVDEWDSLEKCEQFLANQEEIKAAMNEFEQAGHPVGQPIIRSYRVLDTPDRY